MDPLTRYRAVLRGEVSSRYLIGRSIEVEMREDDSLEELWKLHRSKLWEVKEKLGGKVTLTHRKTDLIDLKSRISQEMFKDCCFCEEACRVDRSIGRRGKCGVLEPRIASDFVHHGEEPPLVPSYTIFFAGCNLSCVYCQNYDISTDPRCGRTVDAGEMADRIDRMTSSKEGSSGLGSGQGIRNVNWVGGDPTPGLNYILDVLSHMRCNIPQVWNSNMYLSREAMMLLDGTMDIYLTDLKYGNDVCARRLSGASRYMEVVTRNHLLAARQGEVMVRHLMLPGHMECCTMPVIEWLADNLSGALVNLMAQYHPEHRAREFPELMRHISVKEHVKAIEYARTSGLLLI